MGENYDSGDVTVKRNEGQINALYDYFPFYTFISLMFYNLVKYIFFIIIIIIFAQMQNWKRDPWFSRVCRHLGSLGKRAFCQ